MASSRLPAVLCRCRTLIQRFSLNTACSSLEHHVPCRILLDVPCCRTILPPAIVCANKHTWTGNNKLNMRSLPRHGDADNNTGLNNKNLSDSDKTERREGILDDIVVELLQVEQEISSDIWDDIQDKLAGTRDHFKKGWPVKIMMMLANSEPPSTYAFDLGQSLLQYYRDNVSEKSSVAMLVPYIMLCASHGGDERSFDAACEELCRITDVLDAMSASMVIRAYSLTSRWRECFMFLDMVKLTSEPSSSSYSQILVAALKAGDVDTVEELIDTMVSNGLVPTDDVFRTMMTLDDGSGQMVDGMLHKMSSHAWIPSMTVVEQLKDWFESQTNEKWTGTYVDITDKGLCGSCRKPLEPLSTITPEEFTELRESFLAKSVKRGNIFMNTSPEELNRISGFLREHAPFDVVVDALNVSRVASQKASLQYRAKLVEKVVDHFASTYNMKVLVMGRKHMKRWPAVTIRRIEKLAVCFYAENISADDPFMLYASLYSGQRTVIVTRDELRDHRFLLGPELATKFKQWQRGHQMVFDGLIRKRNGQEVLKFTLPDVHETRVQQSPSGWHIPFVNEGRKTSYQLATKWLCLTRRVTK